MAVADRGVAERLLTVRQVAELLGTTERFPRRLIAERRIEFVKVGRYVRIRESALLAFIEAGRVEALTVADVWPGRKGAA
jgi:excisionase family DNA binding protein